MRDLLWIKEYLKCKEEYHKCQYHSILKAFHFPNQFYQLQRNMDKASEIAHWSPQIILTRLGPVTGISIIWGDQWAISDALFFNISL